MLRTFRPATASSCTSDTFTSWMTVLRFFMMKLSVESQLEFGELLIVPCRAPFDLITHIMFHVLCVFTTNAAELSPEWFMMVGVAVQRIFL